MSSKTENRWALVANLHKEGTVLLGQFCYDEKDRDGMKIPTFPRREDARRAKRRLSSYRSLAKVVKVRVTVEPIT